MKKILTALIMFLMMTGMGMAVPIPLPIDIQFTPAAQYVVTVTNLNTGISIDKVSDSGGYVHYDWTNYDSDALYSHKYQAKIGENFYDLTMGADGIEAYISVTGVSCVPQIVEKEVIVEVPAVCPECPSCEVCSVCPELEVCPETDCPVKDMTVERIIEGIVLLIVGMGVYKYGFGIKIYTKKDGTVEVQHKHRNVTGYHDINTMHRTQPHKKGELNPKYDNEGKYMG